MNIESALEALHFDSEYIDCINGNNSEALICIIKHDLTGLKDCLNWLKEYRKDVGDDRNPKLEYEVAIEYFVKKLEKGETK